ncbi:putative quinol monooxygenase [Nocardia sp. NPDC004604]|uniref:putative quinol monooxygenase n=1 Tax=Nocardia sp. NPDC004604 TaxID=3157013 RepID=UPI0033B0AC8A
MTAKYFQVIAHYRARPESVDAVIRHLHELAAASRNEAANLSYEFFQEVDDPAHIVILERYTDAAGFAAHRDQEHFQRIGLGQIIPRLDSRTVDTFVSAEP